MNKELWNEVKEVFSELATAIGKLVKVLRKCFIKAFKIPGSEEDKPYTKPVEYPRDKHPGPFFGDVNFNKYKQHLNKKYMNKTREDIRNITRKYMRK